MGDYEIKETCSDDNGCTSGDTHAIVIFAVFGVGALIAWCSLCFMTVTKGSRVPPFECAYYIFVGASPRCEHEMVLDESSFEKAVSQYNTDKQELEGKIATEANESKVISVKLVVEGNLGIELLAYPHCTVQVLEAQLDLPEETRVKFAGRALPQDATLESQAIVEGTELEVSAVGIPTPVPSGTDHSPIAVQITVPSPLQEQLKRMPYPDQEEHQMAKSTPVCCYWGGNLEADILRD